MSAAIQKVENYVDGVDISQFEVALDIVSEQLRMMDQKVMMKTEQEIMKKYENYRYNILNVKQELNHVK